MTNYDYAADTIDMLEKYIDGQKNAVVYVTSKLQQQIEEALASPQKYGYAMTAIQTTKYWRAFTLHKKMLKNNIQVKVVE